MEDEDLNQMLKERTHDLQIYEQKLSTGMSVLKQMVKISIEFNK